MNTVDIIKPLANIVSSGIG